MKLSVAVDRLGELQQKIAFLDELAEDLKETIKKQGVGVHAGEHFEALVSEQERTYVDWLKVALKMKIPQRVIKRYSKKTPVTVLQIREKVK